MHAATILDFYSKWFRASPQTRGGFYSKQSLLTDIRTETMHVSMIPEVLLPKGLRYNEQAFTHALPIGSGFLYRDRCLHGN